MRGIGAAVGAGVGAGGAGRGPAMAAGELSVDQRLDDRREVAAGTRAQVLGFEDGRFYAQGWHITGEMGGIVTPPLKLLDSVSFGVDGQWIGKATQFTSGAGYVRYDLPRTAGIDVAAHRRRAGRRPRRAARARADATRAAARARCASRSTRTPS